MQALSALRPVSHLPSAVRFAQGQGAAPQPQAQIGMPTLFACESCGGKNKGMEGGFMHEHGHHMAMGAGIALLALGALVARRLMGKRQSQPPSDATPSA